MGNFLRSKYGISDARGFMQGAARILIAPQGTAWPNGIEDFLVLPAGPTQYDAVTPWDDVGFTKTGINISRNNAEDDFDVDQLYGSLKRRPSNWEMSVGTQLEESTLETFKQAWELGPISTVTKTTPQLDERHIGMGAPTSYVEQMVAVLYQFEDGGIRAYVWRRCVHAAQESAFTLQKTGDQVSLPQRWNCLADTSASTDTAFGEIFDQVAA